MLDGLLDLSKDMRDNEQPGNESNPFASDANDQSESKLQLGEEEDSFFIDNKFSKRIQSPLPKKHSPSPSFLEVDQFKNELEDDYGENDKLKSKDDEWGDIGGQQDVSELAKQLNASDILN